MISRHYRSDYDGEFVITNTLFVNGIKEQEREWVDNPITNKHVSNRATCIADGPSIEGFLLNRLENHVGGLLGSLSMQVYGVQDVYKKLKCDFLVALGQGILDEIKESEYDEEDNIVYTSAKGCLDNQGSFYLIPQGTRTTPHALAIWLACFDEHEEIFLFGYDLFSNGREQSKMVSSVEEVMITYPTVKFYHVRKGGDMPESWKYLPNIDSMTIQEYVSYADIS